MLFFGLFVVCFLALWSQVVLVLASASSPLLFLELVLLFSAMVSADAFVLLFLPALMLFLRVLVPVSHSAFPFLLFLLDVPYSALRLRLFHVLISVRILLWP